MGTQPQFPGKTARSSRLLLVALVAGNLALQLLAVKLIKDASLLHSTRDWAFIGLMVLVFALSFGRFVFWGAMHKRYPLSLAYPVNALLFPLVVALAWFYGEPVEGTQVLGAVIVSAGVVLTLLGSSSHDEEVLP